MIYELPDRIGFSLRFFSLTHGTKGATKMKRLLTAGIFGTILGIVGTGTANASIVSSGFLDEKLTEMTNATTLQLDTKANQSDLTALSNKIGTLPSGDFPEFGEYEKVFSVLNQPLTYPTSLAELITAIYGNSETGKRGLLAAIFRGLPYDSDDNGSYESYPSIIQNFFIAKDAFDLARANDTKIGTLPTEYATVGAALTAIKGIAEDAKAAALAAIPDPKQEGSSGKFVLTVDIVGDNATYHWEKIDREGETTTE